MWSKSVIVVCACLGLSSLASGQVYKWTDEQGKVHYGDQPPNQQSSKQIAVQKSAISNSAGTAEPGSGPVEFSADPRCNGSNCVNAAPPQAPAQRSADTQPNMPIKSERLGSAAEAKQKAIAKCEANRGAKCKDPDVIRSWIAEDTPITPEEQARAAGERRFREEQERLYQRR